MAIHGSMPKSKRCIVPPMRKPWPMVEGYPSLCQILLHLSMNHVHLKGDQEPLAVSKVKRGASGGRLVFDDMWCSKARVGLHWHVESDMLMQSPLGLVFVHGTLKLMNAEPLEATLSVMAVDLATCDLGSKVELIRSSPNWQQH